MKRVRIKVRKAIADDSLHLALAVLAIVERRFIRLEQQYGKDGKPYTFEDRVSVQTFSTCRSEGFVIVNYDNDRAIAVSEARGSDSIRLLPGMYRDFRQNFGKDEPRNEHMSPSHGCHSYSGPDIHVFDKQLHLERNQKQRAAKYIIRYLEGKDIPSDEGKWAAAFAKQGKFRCHACRDDKAVLPIEHQAGKILRDKDAFVRVELPVCADCRAVIEKERLPDIASFKAWRYEKDEEELRKVQERNIRRENKKV